MILSFLLVSMCIHVSLTAVFDGFKTYKNYKIYEMDGDKYEMNKIMTHLRDNYVSPSILQYFLNLFLNF